ncbi:DHS-like NAD/FAD-binding domain-containing protein, partial [Periconia macrospinosa]
RPPLLRVPYTDPFPAPRIIPASASTPSGAVEALVRFLAPSLPNSRHPPPGIRHAHAASHRIDNGSGHEVGRSTLFLTGAGISVASGLADYRGTNGTYTLNRTYRPIYYHEFCANHEARKRYWARSFLGWTNLSNAKPNIAHYAVGRLGSGTSPSPSPSSPSTGEKPKQNKGLGIVQSIITQNVDSFHPIAHPTLPTTELHGYLRTLTCISCGTEYPRDAFQLDLRRLNPTWADFLDEMLDKGALASEDPKEREKLGLKTNPDGDVDVPGARYETFRYPACPTCLNSSASSLGDDDGDAGHVHTDADGAYIPSPSSPSPSTSFSSSSTTATTTTTTAKKGILKPSVIMFGESIPASRKLEAERAVDAAGRILVVGSSLATYSAWRLVKRARDRGLPVGILNIGGCRGEDVFFAGLGEEEGGEQGVRVSLGADVVLPRVVEELERLKGG